MRRRDLLAGGVSALLVSRLARSEPLPSDTTLDARLAGWMDLAGVPGVVIVEIDGAAVRLSPRGVADAETRRPVTTDTIFEAASLSKPVVAACVLSMRDEGLFDLDLPLSAVLPDLRPDPLVSTITARHALSHSSGLPNWRRLNEPLRSSFPPGERFSYSGEGFFLLQRAIEQLSGRPFCGEVSRRILKPLGMSSTSFVFSPETDSRRAQGHGSRGNPAPSWNRRVGRKLHALGEATGRPFEHWTTDEAVCALPSVDPDAQAMPAFAIPNAAGSLVTSGPDYARFLQAILGIGAGRGAFSDRSRREMREPTSFLPGPLAWGLGWGLDRSTEGPSLWHWGDNGPFQNFVTVDVAERRALLVFTNGNGGRKVYERVARARLGRDLPAFAWI